MGGAGLPPCGAVEGQLDADGRATRLSREQRGAGCNAAPAVKQTWRQCWRCDCDGVSHQSAGYDPRSGAFKAVQAMAGHIKSLTGHEPPSCPWRVFYSPLVAEVVAIASLGAEGFERLAIEDDPPAILIDGLRAYLAAKNATKVHDGEIKRKEWERDRRSPPPHKR